MGIQVSILLINTIGFALCAGVVVANVFGLYKKSQKDVDLVSPEDVSLNAEVLGLSIEMARWGLDFVESKTDDLFENSPAQKLTWKILEPFQIEPDGHYFKSAHYEQIQEEWNGYETKEDVPVYRLGKFEMFI